MTTPMLMTEHPTAELLAEYKDNRLDSSTREPVTAHLATCGECTEILVMTTAYQMDEETAAGVVSEDLSVRLGDATRDSGALTVYDRGALATRSGETLLVMENPARHVSVHRTFGARRRVAAIGGLAAAAALAVMVVQPSSLYGPKVNDLIAASQGEKTRKTAGQLAGGFAYAEKPRTDRGVGNQPGYKDGVNPKLYEIAADLQAQKSRDPHVYGLSILLIAEKRDDFSDAIASLKTAYDTTSGDEHDSVAIDLAAALIGRARWSSTDDDYKQALKLSNAVLQRSPKSAAALWNRAVALELTNQDNDEVLRAYDDYLKVDPSSKWADEARDRKATIESFR